MAAREAACQLCDFLKHLVRDEVAQLKRYRIRQVLRFAAQPPMHFRTMPLDPAPDYSMFGNADFTDRFSRIPVAMPTPKELLQVRGWNDLEA